MSSINFLFCYVEFGLAVQRMIAVSYSSKLDLSRSKRFNNDLAPQTAHLSRSNSAESAPDSSLNTSVVSSINRLPRLWCESTLLSQIKVSSADVQPTPSVILRAASFESYNQQSASVDEVRRINLPQ